MNTTTSGGFRIELQGFHNNFILAYILKYHTFFYIPPEWTYFMQETREIPTTTHQRFVLFCYTL